MAPEATFVKKRSSALLVFVIWFSFSFGDMVSADPFADAVSRAMHSLAVSKDDPELLMMTDATYLKIDAADALPYLGQARALTGCTVGKGNLLFFQRPQAHPLRLMLYVKKSGQPVIISRVGTTWVSETLDLSGKTITTPDFWEKAKVLEAGKDMFSLAAIANVWAHNRPYDFLKSAELHNHICPDLTSGYLIAHYILAHYPLKSG